MRNTRIAKRVDQDQKNIKEKGRNTDLSLDLRVKDRRKMIERMINDVHQGVDKRGEESTHHHPRLLLRLLRFRHPRRRALHPSLIPSRNLQVRLKQETNNQANDFFLINRRRLFSLQNNLYRLIP